MVDGAYRIPGKNQAFFWSGTQYARVTYNVGGGDKLEFGPESVRYHWKQLAHEDIGRVDAVCPVPGNKERLYVFSGANYVKLGINTESLVRSLVTARTPITKGWTTLGRAGWDRIDAAMVVPGSETNVYFFRGKEWIDVSWEDELVSHGTIAESWPSLVEAKFETVDAILDNYDNTYYVFSGDQCARIRMDEDKDTLVTGPYCIADKWTSLHWI
ncbi:hypothetical protein BDV39DRAFT_179981 [Aspergillus sergii]|uniref:Hemopexin n=1 Tax=Aspergillus sergii TaxID=1034303 RepID=A0A5N6WW34_9EURO|nr:hypothetical protein BDV39DRAFT_179981 [Aspergillus sergii]